MSTPARVRRNPIALLFSSAPWAALAYLSSYVLLGPLGFAIALGVLVVGVVLSITWVGLPVLFAGLATIRRLADAERARAGFLGMHLRCRYRSAAAPGLLPALRARLRDPATWRDVVLLIVAWPWLFALDLAALVIWLSCLGLISCPIWYSYIPQTFDNGTTAHGISLGYYPDGPHGARRYGWFIDDLHSSLIAAGIGVVVLVLVANVLVVATARAHVRLEERLTGSPSVHPAQESFEVSPPPTGAIRR